MTKKIIKKLAWTLIVLAGIVILALVAAMLTYPPVYVFRVIAWGNSDLFDWQKFPEHRLEAAPAPFTFGEAPSDRVATLFAQLAGVDSWEAFLEDNQTQAFIVIQDGPVLYEQYFNNTQRDFDRHVLFSG